MGGKRAQIFESAGELLADLGKQIGKGRVRGRADCRTNRERPKMVQVVLESHRLPIGSETEAMNSPTVETALTDAIDYTQSVLAAGEHVVLFGAGPGRARRWLASISCGATVIDLMADPAPSIPSQGPVVSLHPDAWVSRRNLALPPLDGSVARPPVALVLVSGLRTVRVVELSPNKPPVLIWADPTHPPRFGDATLSTPTS